MARLNTTIHVYDGDETIVYLPGQEVLPQHREQITAPGVWEDDPDAVHEQDTSNPEDAGDQSSDSNDGDDNGSDPAGDGSSDDQTNGDGKDQEIPAPVDIVIPPKAGPGASTDVWSEYAAKATAARDLKIEIPADAGRDDIIDALNSAGIPTE